MFKVVLLQIVAALISCALGGALFGFRGVIAAMLGGVVCVVPSFIFACYLYRATRRADVLKAFAFFMGEAAKIALTILGIVVIRVLYPEALWGAVVMGIVITIQANFFAFLVKP